MRQETLRWLFENQDKILKDHLEGSSYLQEVFDLISDGVTLNLEILTSSTDFESEKLDSILYLACDCLSHTVIATRLGLWGVFAEAFSILRGAVESATILEFVVQHTKYKDFAHETSSKFKTISFERAAVALGKRGVHARKFHGRISDAASHTTPTRLKLSRYKHSGQFYTRLGYGMHVETAEIVLFYCMDATVSVLHSLMGAYLQDNKAFTWSDECAEMLARYEKLKKEWHPGPEDEEG